MGSTPLGRLRAVGFIEGCSFVLLLTVAMPLKHGLGINWPVSVVGAAHGGLWVLMLACVAEVAWKRTWPPARTAAAVLASVIPGGPFVLDRSLKREQQAAEEATRPA